MLMATYALHPWARMVAQVSHLGTAARPRAMADDLATTATGPGRREVIDRAFVMTRAYIRATGGAEAPDKTFIWASEAKDRQWARARTWTSIGAA